MTRLYYMPIFKLINRSLFTAVLCLLNFCSYSQTPSTGAGRTQPYGQVDTADLKMTECDFDKGANAVVLFDKTDVNTGFSSTGVSVHRRIKILTKKGTDEGNITLTYISRHGLESISDIEGVTMNLENGNVTYSKLDKTQIIKQASDKNFKKITFTLPNVRQGSVIDYRYKLSLGYEGAFPTWEFQEQLPVRYCELNAAIRNDYSYKIIPNVKQEYVKNTKTAWVKGSDTVGYNYTWAFKNIGSFSNEPFATSRKDNIQRIIFILSAIKFTAHGNLRPIGTTWFALSRELVTSDEFKPEPDLPDPDGIIAAAKKLKTDEEKIAYIFSKIKIAIKWNKEDSWYPFVGVKQAWQKKLGNSSDINLILYSFLRAADIKCSPVLVSTRENGKIHTGYPEIDGFNKTVISATVNDKKSYLLDASDKYNSWKAAPMDILNTIGFFIEPEFNTTMLLNPIKNDEASRRISFVNAQITASGKLDGQVQINRFSYNRVVSLQSYDELGEKKYLDGLRDDDNNLKITSYKRENVEQDTLPLTETVAFQLDLAGSDDNYIFVNPNIFSSFRSNPFLSENRISDIDFGSVDYYAINGLYKIPQGYKIESLPKPTSLMMPDTSITFKRVVAAAENAISVHYTINYKRAVFAADEYPAIRDFYKKMFEMLNEQIVLKKI